MLEMQKMGTREKVTMPQNFMAFRNSYLFVYSLMMAGDWLQGPYVYALYQHYGYTTGDIGKLFIAGFGSSMISAPSLVPWRTSTVARTRR